MKGKVFIIALFLILCSCNTKPLETVTYISAPASLNGSESSLHKADDGSIYLSWIETNDNSSKLLLAKLNEGNTWSEPQTIASGDNWFINWADFPSVTSFGSNLVAHYLEKSASDIYAYDVKLTVSKDGGNNWSDVLTPHTDSTNTEHGFVSKVAMNDDSFLSVWLDGRQMAYAEKDTTITKQMTLRAAVINSESKLENEYLLDSRVCDCCQTDTAMTEEGPIVIYRDRSEAEIRDIYYVKLVNGTWTQPQPIYNDNWKITGCPVNGPAISTEESTVAVAWFTVANNLPSVKVAFSNNNGEVFNEPIEIGDIAPLGRVDIELLKDNSALVSWMDTVEGKTQIQLQRVYKNGTLSNIVTLAESSESRSSGFPRMVVKNNLAYITWTKVNDGNKLSIETAIVNTDLIE
ncbi:sialidase family protein [Pontimicrobium aquaticum]|uniref:Exo-alpha-sialidase n=1 Tax=Pontimicrobium aquaticum TaxID=2565367 RepID=A0A4U0EQI3_9FLAO|nr:sialidase family protein [Pontimicrobium aquaticum]TJY33946.1 exo-alpha-sialidase [Pontimicrobium aquaticum]